MRRIIGLVVAGVAALVLAWVDFGAAGDAGGICLAAAMLAIAAGLLLMKG